MNLLIDGLPEEVEIAGQTVRINTDFRTGILFEELILDSSVDDLEKLQTVLELYYPDCRFDMELIPEAIQAVMWFYRCGDNLSDRQKGEQSSHEDAPFSYEHDADFIYAAFLGAYGIDLARTNLHWWQFRALFRSLPEESQFMKIVSYRSIDDKTLSKLSKEQRQHYKKMKKLYALPQSAERQKLESDLTRLLMSGGNPSALL